MNFLLRLLPVLSASVCVRVWASLYWYCVYAVCVRGERNAFGNVVNSFRVSPFLSHLTGNLLYVSFDRNHSFHSSQRNCPMLPFSWLTLTAFVVVFVLVLSCPLLKSVHLSHSSCSWANKLGLMHTICFVCPFHGASLLCVCVWVCVMAGN